jgi:hypothetical protein
MEVEAWQFDDAGLAMPYWLQQISQRVIGGELRIDIGAEKPLVAALGDWVVLRANGILSVMKEGAFEEDFAPIPPGGLTVEQAIALGHDVRMGIDYGLPARMLQHAIDKSDDHHG